MKTTRLLFACCLLCAHTAIAELLITEVLYDIAGVDTDAEWVELLNTGPETIDLAGYQLCFGGTGYDYSVNVLSGTIAPCQVFVIGGPTSDESNGFPTYDLDLDFTADIQNGGTATDAVAVFAPGADPLTACPVDAVLYGGVNTYGLLDVTCLAGPPAVDDAPAGSSIERTALTADSWIINATPAPNVVDFDCGGTPTDPQAWGAVKAIYR